MSNFNLRIKSLSTWPNRLNTIKNLKIHKLTIKNPMESISFSKTKINSISLIIKTNFNKIMIFTLNQNLPSNTRNQSLLKIWPESTKTNQSQKESNKDPFSTPPMILRILSIPKITLQNKSYSHPLKLSLKPIITSIL